MFGQQNNKTRHGFFHVATLRQFVSLIWRHGGAAPRVWRQSGPRRLRVRPQQANVKIQCLLHAIPSVVRPLSRLRCPIRFPTTADPLPNDRQSASQRLPIRSTLHAPTLQRSICKSRNSIVRLYSILLNLYIL